MYTTVCTHPHPHSQVYALAFAPDASYVAVGGDGDGGVCSFAWKEDGTIQVGKSYKWIWGADNGDAASIWASTSSIVYALAFSPDSKLLAVGGCRDKVVVYAIAERAAVFELSCLDVSALVLTFEPLDQPHHRRLVGKERSSHPCDAGQGHGV